MAISNRDQGDANHQALSAYLDRVGREIPMRPDGTVDVARIVREVPLGSRGIIYQNVRNRTLLNERLERFGFPSLGDKAQQGDGDGFQRPGAKPASDETKQLRRRVDQLERELTAARGEIAELRRAARRYAAIDLHMADTGRLPR
jgi:hypothetical protein